MHPNYIEDMVCRLKLKTKGRVILERYWSDKMALVWSVADVFRAANERGVALTKREAIKLLQELHGHHNRQTGIKWEDLTTCIEDQELGRKMTQAEIKRFVEQELITVQK